MGKAKYKQWSRITSILLLSVVLFLMLSRVIWQHAHVMSDGTVITHTHPYSKSADSTPFKNHHHSNFEILFLQYLENIVPILPALSGLAVLTSSLRHFLNPIIHVISFIRVYAPGRSPPVL